ncbi:MAG: tetratricopeptide repeat protein [Verrucomicrobiales bacterium]
MEGKGRKAEILAAAGVLVLTLIVFGRVLGFGFVLWDDDMNVTENPHYLEDPLGSIGFFWANWREGYLSLWIPLTYTVWAVLAHLAALPAGMLDPESLEGIKAPFESAWFHGANLCLHLLSSLLVYLILRRLTSAKWPWAAAFGAVVFALHPIQVEPVAWVTGMKDVLAGSLALGALWAYLSAFGSDRRRARGSMGFFALATLFFIAALTAKPSSVMVPAIAFVLEVAVLGGGWRRAARRLSPWFAAAVTLAVVTFLAQSGGVFNYQIPGWLSRPVIALDAIAFYLARVAVPFGLGPDYGRSPGWLFEQGIVFVSWILPCLAAAAAWFAWRRGWKLAGAGAIVFGLALLPVLGLVPFAFQGISTVADRYLYLSMLGVAMVATDAVEKGENRLRARAVAIALMVLLSALSWRQAGYWKNTATLFARGLEVNPRAWLIYYNQGVIATENDFRDEALAFFQRSLEIHPKFVNALSNLGAEYNHRGEKEKALEIWRRALSIEPGKREVLTNLTRNLVHAGRFEEALAEVRTSFDKVPWAHTVEVGGDVYFEQGAMLFNKGDFAGAIPMFERAIELVPDKGWEVNLGHARNNLAVKMVADSDLEGAISLLVLALDADPSNRDAGKNLAYTLRKVGRDAEALAVFQRIAGYYRGDLEFLYLYGEVLGRNGRAGEALVLAKQALEVSRASAPGGGGVAETEILGLIKELERAP